MQPEDYPAQDKLGDFALPYVAEITRRAQGIQGEDVLYGEDPYQSVGIHRAKNPNGTVFAFMHGGGWTNGYKEWNDFMAPAFTEKGITFVSVGYRLAPMHLFPAGENDCAAAVAWIFKNIARYGGDPNRIYLGGHSAGGHYASLLAIKKDWQMDHGLPSDVICGCVSVSGVYRLGEGSGLSNRPRFLGEPGRGISAAASPIEFVEDATCPFLMAHGDNDFPHLKTQAAEMEAALSKAGSQVARVILDDSNHFDAHLNTSDAVTEWKNKIVNFMAV